MIEKYFQFNKIFPTYDHDLIYHNTSFQNVDSIIEKGLLCDNGAKARNGAKDYEGDLLWATKTPKGYGGTTIAFKLKPEWKRYEVNNGLYAIPHNIPPEDIVFIDMPICTTPAEVKLSQIPDLINRFGIEKVKQVASKRMISPFTEEDLQYILDYIQDQQLLEALKRMY